MSESEKYKQFAADCIRMAETLGGEDREKLLKIADVWTESAGNRSDRTQSRP